jgi:hypothetical protein
MQAVIDMYNEAANWAFSADSQFQAAAECYTNAAGDDQAVIDACNAQPLLPGILIPPILIPPINL